MPAKKKTVRTSSKKPNHISTENKIAVILICSSFVMVGIFLVYKTFAATVNF